MFSSHILRCNITCMRRVVPVWGLHFEIEKGSSTNRGTPCKLGICECLILIVSLSTRDAFSPLSSLVWIPPTANLLQLGAVAMDALRKMEHFHWQIRFEDDLQHSHFAWHNIQRGQLGGSAIHHNLITNFQIRCWYLGHSSTSTVLGAFLGFTDLRHGIGTAIFHTVSGKSTNFTLLDVATNVYQVVTLNTLGPIDSQHLSTELQGHPLAGRCDGRGSLATWPPEHEGPLCPLQSAAPEGLRLPGWWNCQPQGSWCLCAWEQNACGNAWSTLVEPVKHAKLFEN